MSATGVPDVVVARPDHDSTTDKTASTAGSTSGSVVDQLATVMRM